MLAFPDFNQPFRLEIDTSNEGLGAIFSQLHDGKYRVITYASHRMQNESSMEYNNPLSNLQSAKLRTAEQRWASQLALFNFNTKYKPGRTNQNVDALYRMPHDVEDSVPVATTGEVRRPFHSIAKSTPIPTTLVSAVEVFAQEGTAAEDLGQPGRPPFPLYSRAELQSIQQQDPIIKQFFTYWDTDKKPDVKVQGPETKETASLLKQ